MPVNCSKPSTNTIRGSKGTSNHAESGKGQPGLRKSSRLLGEPALRRSPRLLVISKPQQSRIPARQLPQCSQVSTRKHRKPTQSSKTKFLPVQTGSAKLLPKYPRYPDFVALKRSMRQTHNMQFHMGYKCFGTEKRTIIFSGGEQDIQYENSTGVMWIAVRGMKLTCVVYRNKDLDRRRLTGYLLEAEIPDFIAPHLICEIEDIADQSGTVHQRVDLSDKKPFAVVTVSPSTSNVHGETYDEASAAVPSENKAIEFLRSTMNGGSVLTDTAVVQTAIIALQLMFQQKFKGDEIEVVKFYQGIAPVLMADVAVLMPEHIDEYLGAINMPVSKDLATTNELMNV